MANISKRMCRSIWRHVPHPLRTTNRWMAPTFLSVTMEASCLGKPVSTRPCSTSEASIDTGSSSCSISRHRLSDECFVYFPFLSLSPSFWFLSFPSFLVRLHCWLFFSFFPSHLSFCYASVHRWFFSSPFLAFIRDSNFVEFSVDFVLIWSYDFGYIDRWLLALG